MRESGLTPGGVCREPAPPPAPVAAVDPLAALKAFILPRPGLFLDRLFHEADIAVARLLADARAEGAREIADWYRETFCPSHGVKSDETHARGDCAACNIAAAIRARATR